MASVRSESGEPFTASTTKYRRCPPSSTGQGVLVSIEGRRLCLEVDDAELLVRDRVLSMAAGTSFPWACGVARHAGGLVPLLDLFALSSRFLEAEPT